MLSRWSLRRRITALCACTAVLLGLIAIAATVTATVNRTQVDRFIDRTGPAPNHAERLLAAARQEQSAVRTYAVSGVAADLAQYEAGRTDEQALDSELAALLADRPALLAALADARAQLAAWRAQVADPLVARVRATGPDPAFATPTEAERFVYQRAINAIQRLGADLATARATARDDVHRSGNLLVWLLVCAGVVVLGAAAGLTGLLHRFVNRPVVDLAAEVRQVARGDYEHGISASEPPEMVRLARDVDAMRLQIVRDLGVVRRTQRELEEANEQLERQAEDLARSNRDLEQFAYVASHDLQEPLRKVASFCQLLQRRYAGQLDERADQYIAFAVDGAQRMQRLINDLLAFSRIGRMTSGFTDVDLNQVLADAARQLDGRLEQTGGELTWSDLPVVRGEEALLSALLTNLVGNSLKFRDPQRPPHVHVSAERVGDEWQISCTDNGIGIEAEFADKVFVIFQRLHPKDEYPGTGIGLAIAKKIVEYHGGRIWMDPESRAGTLIRFTLPAVPAPVDEPTAAPDPGVADAAGATGATGSEPSAERAAGAAPRHPSDVEEIPA